MAEKDNKKDNVSNLVLFFPICFGWITLLFSIDLYCHFVIFFFSSSNEIIRLSQNNCIQLFFYLFILYNYIILKKNEIHLPEWNNW